MASLMEQASSYFKTAFTSAYRYPVSGIFVLVVISLISAGNLPLLYGVVDLLSIVMMVFIFFIIWNARGYLNNNYLLILGVSLIAVASIDLIHSLSYGEASVLARGAGMNATAQLWIAARLIQAGSLIAAPFFIRKKIHADTVLIAYIILPSLVLLSILYWDIFPAFLFLSTGGGEYVIAAISVVSLALLARRRFAFDRNVFVVLCTFIAITIASEVSFGLSADTYDLPNLVGHLLRTASFYVLYWIVAIISFKDPYKLLLQSVKQKERELEAALEHARMHEDEAIKSEQKSLAATKSMQRALTEHQESERRLKEYAQKMEEAKALDEALLLSIADGILVTDTSGKITFVNRALEKLCGMPAKEILHRDLDEAIPFFDDMGRRIPKKERPVYIALDPEKRKELPISTSTTLYLINKKTKRKMPLAISAAPFTAGEKTLGAIVAWRDITHEWEIDKAKSEFISFASHQLRTPLTSVSLSIDMLLNQMTDALTREQKKYLKIAREGIKNMTDLIETLLNISRIQMGTLVVNTEPIRLGRFLDTIAQDISLSLKEREMHVKKAYETGLPAIEIDRRLMKIVLENLISNAMKYSPVKSTILLEITTQGTDAVISVSDMGDGIPKEQQEKVFERLFRVQIDGKVKGTGLGLYMVKTAVDQYGGRVWCESPSPRAFRDPQSAESKGTTFFVTVPLAGMSAK